ncbi:zinc finger BED domain-containing protein 1-like [Acyrthosiphon pisum]|uniref:Uncharacterized protein n=1 Tax=Acyrthosiphon pisum TaxID=7029 RepID=A0A8R2B5E6_ACYPI|nr:zinc finger BED domain-containing protein 1-like [Acyrthosiphon pisum]|eukprot:XP_008182397.1 PREDICTED: zinc finger BED domain-containing protein 1-like [Acyrthosiphon pisum]
MVWSESQWIEFKEKYPWIVSADGKLGCNICSSITCLGASKKERLRISNEWNHLKRKHPLTLNMAFVNEDDPDSELLTVTNLTGPSTSSISSSLPNNDLTTPEPLLEPPVKRQRQLRLYVSKLKGMLKTVLNVSVTTDMWTSDSNNAYITVTCHFIFDDILYSPVATREVHDSHTGEHIAASLSLIFNEWEIGNKIVTVVSDNGANIKNAINQHLKKHQHPCVAHTLNLSVIEAINNNNELSHVIQTCKTIVGHFKHSTSATEKLKMYQNQMGLPQLKVKQDVSTRWNSKLILMERLLQIKDPLSAAINSLPRAPNGLTALEWELIEDCIPLLKPFESMTTELSGEKYPTLSMFIPLIRGLQFTLGNIKPKTNSGRLLKTALSNSVSRRLGSLEGDKTSSKSTFIDPRLKKTAFGLVENANQVQKWIEEELCAMISENTNEDLINNVTIPHDDTSIQDQTSSLWKHFDTKVAQVKTTATPSVMVTLMMRQVQIWTKIEEEKRC